MISSRITASLRQPLWAAVGFIVMQDKCNEMFSSSLNKCEFASHMTLTLLCHCPVTKPYMKFVLQDITREFSFYNDSHNRSRKKMLLKLEDRF